MKLEAEVQKAEPGNILSEEMKKMIREELGMTKEEIWKADYTDGPISFEFLPLGFNGGLVRGVYAEQDIIQKSKEGFIRTTYRFFSHIYQRINPF